MTADRVSALLKRWQEEAILSDEDIVHVMQPRHPHLAAVAEHIHTLVMLVRTGVLSEDRVRRSSAESWKAMLSISRHLYPSDPMKAEELVDVALYVMEQLRRWPSFEVLLAGGLVKESECIVTLLACDNGHKMEFESPPSTLAWMLNNRFISSLAEAEMFAVHDNMPPDRVALLSETALLLEGMRPQPAIVRPMGRRPWVYPSVLVVFGILAWVLFA